MGRISRGHPGVIRADIPAQNFGQGAQKAWKKQALGRGPSMTRRHGGISKNFGQKNFGLNFRSLIFNNWENGMIQGGAMVAAAANKTPTVPGDSPARSFRDQNLSCGVTGLGRECHSKAIPGKAFPIFPLFSIFSRADRLHVPHFPLFGGFILQSFFFFFLCARLILMFRIFYGLNMRKIGCLILSGMAFGTNPL